MVADRVESTDGREAVVIEIAGKKLEAKVEKLGVERDGEGRIRSVTMTLLIDKDGKELVSDSFRDPMDPNWFHGDLPKWKAKISWEHQNATKEEIAAMILMDEGPTTVFLRPTSLRVEKNVYWYTATKEPTPLEYFRAVIELQVIAEKET